MRKFKNIDAPLPIGFESKKTKLLRGLFRDKFVVGFSLAWFLPIVVSAIYISVNLPSLPSQIPLFYSKVWGEGQLASKSYLFLPIVGAFLLGLVNFVIALFIKDDDKLFRYLLLATGAVLSILAAITVFNIIAIIS